MPKVARAVRIREPGDVDVLEVVDVRVREPGPGEVLVEVAAAGVNRADLLQRKGHYPAPEGYPQDIPGLEYAGTVLATGLGVTRVRSGERVMGITAGGAMCTHVVVHEREVMHVPLTISLTDAAAIPEVFLTAYDALFEQGGLAMGERVLVHAVGSGVGVAALQLAQHAGAHVIGTSRTEKKIERCARFGLEDGIVVEEGKFADKVLQKARAGVDLVLDTVGGGYVEENLKALAQQGRIVVVGLLGGREAPVPFGTLLSKRATLKGTVLRSRPLEEKARLAQQFAKQVVPLFATGKLRAVVDEVMPMTAVREAHARMERNETFGKLVLSWGL